jgi:signal transduction histidine kinase
MPETAELQLDQLVAPDMLYRLRRQFAAVTGVPMAFTDRHGNTLTPIEEPLRFCASLVHGVPGALCLRRTKWDVPEEELERVLLARGAEGKPVAHRCRGGFRDMAVPILVQGQVLGYVVFARSLIEEPDLERFRQLAIEGGMAPEQGEAVAKAALVMPRERIAQVAEMLQMLAGLVASAAYDSLRARQVIELEGLRDALIHMIVHDLRTPLTSIIGGLQTVVDVEYDPELTREFVPNALTSANVLVEMVNTLLDINKMESGQMELDLAPLDLRATAEAAVSQVLDLARTREQQLVNEVAEDCPGVVADGEKVRRVMVNLMSNAIKFIPDGGRIVLAAVCDDEGLLLAVSDNGPGIPEEYRERIFEKFGQVEGRTSKLPSTGLGLTFCRMVAEAHGGRIWVESVVGEGSTFYVRLPRRSPSRRRVSPLTRNLGAAGDRRPYAVTALARSSTAHARPAWTAAPCSAS